MDLEMSLSWGFIIVMFFSILYLSDKVEKICNTIDVLQKAMKKFLDFQNDTIDLVHSFEHRIDVLKKESIVNHQSNVINDEENKHQDRRISDLQDHAFMFAQKLSDMKTTIDESLKKLEAKSDKDYFDTMI